MKNTVYMSLERGVLFIEHGTEVSNVSVELLKASPSLLWNLKQMVELFDTPSARGGQRTAIISAKQAIEKAEGNR